MITLTIRKLINKIIPVVALTLGMVLFPDMSFSKETPISNELVLNDQKEVYSLGKYIDYLEDTESKWTIEEILKGPLREAFKHSNTENINFGFTASTYWLRFNLIYEADKFKHANWFLEIAYPLLDHIDAYLFTGSRVVKKISTGRSMPYKERAIKNRNFILPFDLQSGKHYTLFLRIKTGGSMNFPLAFRTPLSSMELVKDEQFFFGIYYGILIVMAIFNLFLFTTVRSINYLLYVLYVVSWGFLQLALNGLDVELLWRDAQWLSLKAVPLLGSLTAIGMNLFTKRFLQSKDNAPFLDKIHTILVAVFIVNTPVSLFGEYSISVQIMTAFSLGGSFIMLATGIRCWIKGFRPARLFVISWMAFICGIIIYNMKTFGLLPYSFITNNSIQIGSALEVVLMSFALADRFRIMQKEKEDVQKQAFEEQLKMTNSFSRFVPREFLSLLKRDSIVNIELGDQVLQEMPVFFTDIRSYTSLSEKMTPLGNIDFLNQHLANIVPVIKKHNGFIDKYIGDAIMALFPGGVNDAVSTAVEMQKKVKEFNKAGNASGNGEIRIGIGIHIGSLMLGTIGQEDRLETTVISDAVNIASRLESLNKHFNTGILISEDVFNKLDNPDQFNIKKIGLVKIRGKENPVRVLEIAVD